MTRWHYPKVLFETQKEKKNESKREKATLAGRSSNIESSERGGVDGEVFLELGEGIARTTSSKKKSAFEERKEGGGVQGENQRHRRST